MQSQRQIDAATFQADYQDAATQADRAKRIALAQAAKTRDLDLATDDAGQSDWQYGYFSLSAAEKTYRKAIADADWAYQTAVADALRALQSADAASKATYTTAAANLDFAYETGIAGHELTYQHSVADANRTKASADADARRDYLNAEAGARSGRRTAIAASSVAQLTSDAAGVLAAYDHVDQQYSLPYTAYLRGLAQINQVVASQIATATTNLESNRNSADNLYYNQTIGASHTMELAYADAVKTHDRETATADRDAAVDDATAAKDFYVNLATPASDYARDLAAAQATHSIDVATAAKTLVHEQADEVDGASANHQAAARTADDTFAGTRTTVEQTWWTAEAGKQADLLIAQAQAERDRFVDMLTADKNQIVSQNNAQSTYRTTSAHAYHASESAWAQHEHTFRLVAINSSAAQSSGLRDPWSAQDDSLRSGRAQSDRDRAKAERDLQIARITAQRDIELNLFPAETTLRNSNTGATLLGFTSSADDVRDVATAVANAHRNAAATGNRPAQTQVYKQLGGTLNIAGQISVSMPASGWMAVTDRVLDRTLNWTSNIYDQLPDSSLDLTTAISGATSASIMSPNAESKVEEAGRITDTGLTPRVASANEDNYQIDAEHGEAPNSTSGKNILNVVSQMFLNGALNYFGQIFLPKWGNWGAAILPEMATVTLTSANASTASLSSLTDAQGYTHQYEITPSGSRGADNSALDKLAKGKNGKFSRTLSNGVWHHKSFDTKTGKFTMVLVDKAVHEATSHSGGFVTWVNWVVDTVRNGDLGKLNVGQITAFENGFKYSEGTKDVFTKLSNLNISVDIAGAGEITFKKNGKIIGAVGSRISTGRLVKYAGQAGLNVGVRAVGVIFVINAGGQAMANGGDMEDIAKAAAREVVMADFVEGGVKVVVVDGAGRYVRQRFFDENYMGRYLGSNISDVDKNNIRTNIKNHPFLKYWE